MINMSYCRFENTYRALQECFEALDEGNTLSESEAKYCKRLFRDTLDFCRANEMIDDYDDWADVNSRIDEFVSVLSEQEG